MQTQKPSHRVNAFKLISNEQSITSIEEKDSLKILQNLSLKLDAYELLYIPINDNLLNNDEYPIQSSLFALAA